MANKIRLGFVGANVSSNLVNSVALPGATGQSGCRVHGGLHHQARERGRGSSSLWSEARLP